MSSYSEQLETPLVIIGSSYVGKPDGLSVSPSDCSSFPADSSKLPEACPSVSPAVNLKDSSAGVSVSLARGSEKNASNGLPSRNGCQFFSFSAGWTGDTSMRTFAA
jgi:hypothetical protein